MDDNQTRVGRDYRGWTATRHGSGAFPPLALEAGDGMMRHQKGRNAIGLRNVSTPHEQAINKTSQQ